MEEASPAAGGVGSASARCLLQSLLVSLQVNREIVSGLKYIQHTFRKGVKSKCFSGTWVLLCVRASCLSTAVVGARRWCPSSSQWEGTVCRHLCR